MVHSLAVMSIYDPIPGQQYFAPHLPSYDELQGCIRCGRCLPVCPTYQQTQLETFSPRGRLNLLRAVEDARLPLSQGVTEHLYHCLDCRACNTVCPPAIPIGQLIVQGRVAAETAHPRPAIIRFALLRILTGARRAELLSGPVRILQRTGLDRLGVALLRPVPRLGRRLADLAQFAPRFGKPLRSELAQVTPSTSRPSRHRVAFFLGCMMNVAMPDVSRATVRVLTRTGCDVVTPKGQACCGAPHDDQAMRDFSREMARRNIALFEPLLSSVEAIVTDCAGCSAALKEYAEWFADDPAWAARARRFSAMVRDVTEWLDENWPEDLPLKLDATTATYHDPCHLGNCQGVRQQPRRLLGRIDGLALRPLPDSHPVRCCGSAGIYNLTHTPMSMALLDRKMDDVAQTGADVVVSANPGCLLQLEWGNRRRGGRLAVRHVVELLDEGLR